MPHSLYMHSYSVGTLFELRPEINIKDIEFKTEGRHIRHFLSLEGNLSLSRCKRHQKEGTGEDPMSGGSGVTTGGGGTGGMCPPQSKYCEIFAPDGALTLICIADLKCRNASFFLARSASLAYIISMLVFCRYTVVYSTIPQVIRRNCIDV